MRRRKYRVHAAFLNASMINSDHADAPIEFEISIGKTIYILKIYFKFLNILDTWLIGWYSSFSFFTWTHQKIGFYCHSFSNLSPTFLQVIMATS